LIYKKVGHSDLVMVCNTAPSHDVPSHQVWWSCIKWHKIYALNQVFLWCSIKVKQ